MSWTHEKVALAKKLYAEGVSASQIAKRLNALGGGRHSRNAIIGKIHRLGLARGTSALAKGVTHKPVRLSPSEPELPRAAKPEAGPKPARTRVSANNAQTYDTPPSAPLAPIRTVVTDGVPRHWTERPFGGCCYPVSGEGADVFSCCAPVDNPGVRWQYCKAHLRLMQQSPKTPAQRAAIMERCEKMRAGKKPGRAA